MNLNDLFDRAPAAAPSGGFGGGVGGGVGGGGGGGGFTFPAPAAPAAPARSPLTIPMSSFFSNPGSIAASGGARGASSGFQMPNGFAGGVFGVNQAAQSPSYTSGGQVPKQSYTVPAATTAANAAATGGKTVSQGGVNYTPLANTGTTASTTPPALRTHSANVPDGSESTGTDQYGRQFNYAKEVDASGGKVVGVSANGTVLKQGANGSVYDTGATVTATRAPAPAAPTNVAVGRPTQVSQPKSTPVVAQPQQPQQPTQKQRDDEETRRQGAILQ